METFIQLGFYLSSLGFLVATWFAFDAFRKAPQSGLKTVLSYIFIGTGVFFTITVFQKLADSHVYAISTESVDIWWHLMFYLAMISYYLGFKKLASLGSSEVTETATSASINVSKLWGIISLFLLAVLFIIPDWADGIVTSYTSSTLAGFGLHHFIAFIIAGIVGGYLFMAKLFFGQIGKSIYTPMILAVWALSLQHFWELLNESWKVVHISPEMGELGEGVEKIFLIFAAVCIIMAAKRLSAFANPSGIKA